jgi:hypothetical protein
MFPLIALIIIVLIVSLVLMALYFRPELKMTSQTSGTVVSSTLREVRTETERREETVVVVAYTAVGQKCSMQNVLRGNHTGRFPEGLGVQVKYNPAKPEMAAVVGV